MYRVTFFLYLMLLASSVNAIQTKFYFLDDLALDLEAGPNFQYELCQYLPDDFFKHSALKQLTNKLIKASSDMTANSIRHMSTTAAPNYCAYLLNQTAETYRYRHCSPDGTCQGNGSQARRYEKELSALAIASQALVESATIFHKSAQEELEKRRAEKARQQEIAEKERQEKQAEERRLQELARKREEALKDEQCKNNFQSIEEQDTNTSSRFTSHLVLIEEHLVNEQLQEATTSLANPPQNSYLIDHIKPECWKFSEYEEFYGYIKGEKARHSERITRIERNLEQLKYALATKADKRHRDMSEKILMKSINHTAAGSGFMIYDLPVSLSDFNLKIKQRQAEKRIVFRTSDDNSYELLHPTENGYLFVGYEDGQLPVILVTDREGIEGDSIDRVTQVVQYKGLARYTNTLGSTRQAILLKDVWNGLD